MIPSLTASLQGMQVSATRMAVSAHDTANVNTPGFSQSDLQQSEGNPGVRASALVKSPAPSADLSATDLAKEAEERILSSAGYKANAQTLRTQDAMLGELLDLKA